MSAKRVRALSIIASGLLVAVCCLPAPAALAGKLTGSGEYLLRRCSAGSIGATETSRAWYMAEGASAGGFETWILVQNPGSETARVAVTYMTPSGKVDGGEFLLGAGRRRSTNVGDTVKSMEVSTEVTSSRPVVAERSTYCNDRRCATSHIGATAPGKTWYMAEGASDGGFETWILVANPGPASARVDLTYMTEHGRVAGPSFDLEPGMRASRNVGDTVSSPDVSTQVVSSSPVVAERSTYFNGRRCATGSLAAPEPSKTWYMAEGATAGGYETWVLVQNPGTRPARVRLDYMTEYGEAAGPEFLLGPGQRRSTNVGDLVNSLNVSTGVTSTMPVVAERSTYYNNRQCATGSVGATAPARKWYVAEGSSGESDEGAFDTWILVQNPGARSARVNLTYMTEDGRRKGPAFDLAPGMRVSKRIEDTVKASGVSTMVSSDEPVVVDRSTYWNAPAPVLPSSYTREGNGQQVITLHGVMQGANVYLVNTGFAVVTVVVTNVINVNGISYPPTCTTDCDGSQVINIEGLVQGADIVIINTGFGVFTIVVTNVINVNVIQDGNC